jgi:predicted Ser/Thr protein kinase
VDQGSGPVSVDGYEFIRELGRGAMGSVYLARQVALDREVAIKRLIGAAVDPGPVGGGVQAEARLLARLNHQHIVRVYELLTADQDVVMVMEYVPGSDLRRLLAERRLPQATAIDYVEQLAAALDHAHDHGVVHQDVKPGNVMVKPEGILKLGDFGVAQLRAGHARRAAGTPPPLVGTPEYMAPEIVQRDPAADHRADVYSLAVVAYELLAGRLPFPPDPRDPRRTMQAQVDASPPRPGLPGPFEAALLHGLEKRPERRPQSAGELAAALRSALEQTADASPTLASGLSGDTITPWGAARPPAPGEPAEDDAALAGTIAPPGGPPAPARAASMGPAAPRPTVPVRSERPHPARAARRPGRGTALLAVGLVALAVLVLATALIVRGRQPAAPPATRLQVSSVSAAVEPASGAGHCPETDFTFRGTVATNGGAGTITYQWLQPDGQTSAAQSIAVGAGVHRASVTLLFKFSGSGSAHGLAVMHVTSPIDAYSPPVNVTYTCP